MRIFLVGYMGSGKSTLGKKIAISLKVPFIDTDVALEKKLSKSISEIFDTYGEDGFREHEQQILNSIIESSDDIVVSTGGGMPCFSNNMERMNEAGITIFLDLPEGMLVHRLKNGKQNRPLLKDKDLNLFVKEHLVLRRPFYSKAKITIDANWLNIHPVSELLNMLDQLK